MTIKLYHDLFKHAINPYVLKFIKKIKVLRGENSCWMWLGYINDEGYASTFWNGFKGRSAYKLAYEWVRGEVPEGMHLHHICNNRACVNPFHLEVLSPKRHWEITDSVTRRNSEKTHCLRGHEFTKENTYIPPRKKGGRHCRECARSKTREWRNQRRKKVT